jgi:dTDP-4-amino-4,6-dideoxygalactose transaminase
MRMPHSRRSFLGAVSAAASAVGLGGRGASASADAPLAILGGKPVRREPFSPWPILGENDEKGWMEVLRKKRWCRINGDYANRFEETWARIMGAKHCIAVANGTSALITSLAALEVGPGDEVLVSPYTFVATVNAVLVHHALPVFVDTDPETFQVDARLLESSITERTACLLPVHIGGSAADLDGILAVAARHKLPVVEDACQAALAEWKGRKLSTLGNLGCFSFQASKNLNSGEGGAILTNDDRLALECRSFQNNGRAAVDGNSYARNGANLRMTEFQAALLATQLTRLEEQSRRREQNAAYLTGLLREVPGITPARMYDGCTRNAYHLYMMRYDPAGFEGLPRSKFLEALHAEGIPASAGYSPLYREAFLKNTLESRPFRAVYSPRRIADYFERIHCPANDRVCEQGVWLFQTLFLGPRSDMDQIADAVRKVQKQAGKLVNA